MKNIWRGDRGREEGLAGETTVSGVIPRFLGSLNPLELKIGTVLRTTILKNITKIYHGVLRFWRLTAPFLNG